MMTDPSGVPDQVCDLLGVRRGQIVTLKDIPGENGSWLGCTLRGSYDLAMIERQLGRSGTVAP